MEYPDKFVECLVHDDDSVTIVVQSTNPSDNGAQKDINLSATDACALFTEMQDSDANWN